MEKYSKALHAVIIFSFVAVGILILIYFMIPSALRIVSSYLADQQGNADKQVFKNYETFSKKITPTNFILVNTKYEPFGIDTPTSIDQTFNISSTRQAIIDELKSHLVTHGYTFNSVTIAGKLADQQDFFNYNTQSNLYPTDIHIVFIPSDTICNNPSPGTMTQCSSHDPISTVTKVNISLENRGGS